MKKAPATAPAGDKKPEGDEKKEDDKKDGM